MKNKKKWYRIYSGYHKRTVFESENKLAAKIVYGLFKTFSNHYYTVTLWEK